MRLIALIVSIFSFASGVFAQDTSPTARITVQGEGTAAARPDMAIVRLGVVSREETASTAMSETSDKLRDILSALERLSIAGRDVQTSTLSLSPIYGKRNTSLEDSAITGYEARNTLTVRVRDLDVLGRAIDVALERGANEMQGLQFALQYPEPVLAEARRNAVANARVRAETYARAAGLTLGAVLQMSEAGVVAAPVMEMSTMSLRAAGVPIAEGEAEMSARITVVYTLTE